MNQDLVQAVLVERGTLPSSKGGSRSLKLADRPKLGLCEKFCSLRHFLTDAPDLRILSIFIVPAKSLYILEKSFAASFD